MTTGTPNEDRGLPTPDYQRGGVRLYNADCRSIFSKMSNGSVGTVLADFPYGIGYPYHSYHDTRDNLQRLIDECVPECRRVARRVVIFSGVQNITLYPPSDWVACFTWNTTGCFGLYGYNQWQPVVIYGKDRKGFGSVEGILKSDRLQFCGGDGIGFLKDYGRGDHPCPKPLNVMESFVRRFSEADSVVCDPVAGSGTTGVACVKLGRDFIGVEKEPRYFKIAVDRIEAAFEDQALFGEGGRMTDTARDDRPLPPHSVEAESDHG